MKHHLLSLVLISCVAGNAAADPFANLSATGHYDYSAYAQTTNYNQGSNASDDFSADYSFYVGSGANYNLYDSWIYNEYGWIGYDEYGNDIYGDIPIQQTDYAEVSANSYASFTRASNSIDAEVYAYVYVNNWSSGGYGSSSANGTANSSMLVSFSLLANTPVTISSTTNYGGGYMALMLGSDLFVDTTMIGGSYNTILPAGDYTITGSAGWDGGANLKIEAVPEPTSIAALGLGAGLLLRRRRAAKG